MVGHPLPSLFLRMEIKGTLCCRTHVSQNRENLLIHNGVTVFSQVVFLKHESHYYIHFVRTCSTKRLYLISLENVVIVRHAIFPCWTQCPRALWSVSNCPQNHFTNAYLPHPVIHPFSKDLCSDQAVDQFRL